MSDFKIVWVGSNGYSRDITGALSGQNSALPEEERTEMTNWNKWVDMWTRIDNALEKKYQEEKDDADNR